jgi:hypothetical protein
VGLARDNDNYLGADAAAENGEDPLDHPEPPPVHGLSLYFPHPEWGAAGPRYSADIRKLAPDTPHEWSFEVWTDIADRKVELSWGLRGRAPGELWLRDVEGNRLVPMRQGSSYTYDSGAGGVRHFQVIGR